MTRRSLFLKKETLTELAELDATDLAGVAGGADTRGNLCEVLSLRLECGILTCNNQCTNTSTAFKG
ncbi:MAG TPA: hypothetical protein VNA20_15410 [Frankiaceae bacterium]|nr:hypothetical protein [Frankiaceae bacterium]